jgi:hypothetical protein
MLRRFMAVLLSTAFAAVGCTAEPTAPLHARTTSPDPSESATPPASTPPARRAPMPTSFPAVSSFGGPVMRAPRVVPAFFAGDELAADLTLAVGRLVGSDYWRKTTSEYGVGPLTASAGIVEGEVAPATTTGDAIIAWLQARFDGTHPEWGDADENAIYTLFYPATTTITADADQSCVTFGGYHGEADVGGKKIVYAVLPRCPAGPGESVMDGVTGALSHELVEAATDPYPLTAPGFANLDPEHAIWGNVMGGELGDMCGMSDVTFRPPELGFMVQRTWSNAAAAAGHHPCVPYPADLVYFNAAPDLREKVAMDFGDGTHADTLGVVVKVGEKKSLDLVLFSDKPVSAPWTVTVTDLPSAEGAAPELAFDLDRKSGVSGDVVRLTITRLRAPTSLGGTAFTVLSSAGGHENVWVGFAGG